MTTTAYYILKLNIYSSRRDTTNHVPFIAHDISNNTASAEENLLHQAGFELRFLSSSNVHPCCVIV